MWVRGVFLGVSHAHSKGSPVDLQLFEFLLFMPTPSDVERPNLAR